MLNVTALTKTYATANGTVQALDHVDFSINQGEFIVVHGASGSGKTTLLHTLGGMLRPSSGTVTFQGRSIYTMSARRRNHYRRRHVGFVFQKLFLVPYLTAYDNIRLALVTSGYSASHDQRIGELATWLNLEDRLGHRPSQLSVGQQQRVAAARAVAAEPELVLADEPTGNLDQANTDAFGRFLTEENRRGRTIVLVTHSEQLLGLGNRSVKLVDGALVADRAAGSVDPADPVGYASA
jgi:putative ABC transport system ATP-binding protein